MGNGVYLVIRERDHKYQFRRKDGTSLTGWYTDYYRCQTAAEEKLRKENLNADQG